MLPDDKTKQSTVNLPKIQGKIMTSLQVYKLQVYIKNLYMDFLFNTPKIICSPNSWAAFVDFFGILVFWFVARLSG